VPPTLKAIQIEMIEEESHPTGAARGVRFFQLGYSIAFRYKFIHHLVRYKFVPYKLPLGKANWLVLIPYHSTNCHKLLQTEGLGTRRSMKLSTITLHCD
jgi:hypothetical protein